DSRADPRERRGSLLGDARRHGAHGRRDRGDGPCRAAVQPLGGRRSRPDQRPGRDARAVERTRAPPLLGGLARPARPGREDGPGDRQSRRPSWFTGPPPGRAGVSPAGPLAPGDAPRPARGRRGVAGSYPGALSRPPLADVPRAFPGALLRPSSVRTFNALRWWAAPRRERGRPLALAPYFFPLDVLGEWNRLYGASGLVQYQFVIPS